MAYSIVIRNKEIGTVKYQGNKWHASVGNVAISQSSRKGAVEHVLYQLIMLQINKRV